MPSILLSDNGVSSGSAGLKTTAASDGALALQTTTAGGTATTAVTLDTSQNVGVNSTGTIRTKLMVSSSNASDTLTVGTASGGFSITNTNNAYGLQFGSLSTGNSWIQSARLDGTATAYDLVLQSGGGNVGVGTTSPSEKLHVVGKIAVSGTNPSIRQTVQNAYLDLCGGTTVGTDPSIQIAGSTTTSDANIVFYNSNTHIFRNSAGSSERARIDSSGNLLVGTTTVNPSGNAFSVDVGSGITRTGHANGTASGTAYSVFVYNGGAIGTITQNGTTAVAYNTSSDYRLKHDIAPMTGALAKVAALKPVTYKWNADNSDGEGFIAHELAEVCPHAVTGEKDAVDAEGKPVYQGIDTSFLVATLTAAIQELKAIVDAQAAEIAALKGN